MGFLIPRFHFLVLRQMKFCIKEFLCYVFHACSTKFQIPTLSPTKMCLLMSHSLRTLLG